MTVNAALPEWSEPLFGANRYKVIHGGRGGGRSWSVARALLIQASETPLRVLCCREIQASIRDSVHRLFSDQIELLGLGGFQVLDREIRHNNGSLFIFEGLHRNITKIKSMEGIDRCWVEEAETVSKSSWATLIPTIRRTGSEIWVTFNPRYESDPTYVRFVTSPPPGAWVVKVDSHDNPWLPAELEAEREYLWSIDPEAAAHVWGGNPITRSDAQVLRGRWRVEHFEPDDEWGGPYLGADWGFASDPTALVKCWVNGRTLYIEAETYGVGVDIDDTPALFDNIEGASAHVIRADNARPETINYVRRHGYPRIESVQKWPGSVDDGVEHLRSYEEVVIHPDCPHAAEEARLWSYKVDKLSGDVLPALVDKHNHIWDSVRYALTPMIRNVGEIAVVSDDLDAGSRWA